MAEMTGVEHVIKPPLKGRALLEDIEQARMDTANFHLWWLGQSGFLLHWQGRFVLLDPYLSNSLTKKYSATDKPHIRMTEIPIEPDETVVPTPNIDLLLCCRTPISFPCPFDLQARRRLELRTTRRKRFMAKGTRQRPIGSCPSRP